MYTTARSITGRAWDTSLPANNTPHSSVKFSRLLQAPSLDNIALVSMVSETHTTYSCAMAAIHGHGLLGSFPRIPLFWHVLERWHVVLVGYEMA